VNEFIAECRREWRRLGVPDHIANEMAADLRADIDEAESEGGSAEDVLGNSLFDPRQFAAAWAESRGVTGPQGALPLVPAMSGGDAVAGPGVAGPGVAGAGVAGPGAVRGGGVGGGDVGGGVGGGDVGGGVGGGDVGGGAAGNASSPASGRFWTRRTSVTAALAVAAGVLMFGGLALAVGRRGTAVSLSARRILRPGSFRLFRPRSFPQVLLPVHTVGGVPQGVAILAVLMLLVGVIVLGIAIFSWAPWTRRHSK
jgi:hypothetical protein